MDNRKEIELASKRVPLKKIFNGNDFTTVIEQMKKFRAQFAELEILYKAKLYFSFTYGEATVSVRRPETDNELAKRLEAERIEREAKLERKRIREKNARIREQRKQAEIEAEAKLQRQRDIEIVKQAARNLGLTANDLF